MDAKNIGMIYELLLITAIVSFGIDVAGFVETIKEKGSRGLGVRIRYAVQRQMREMR